MSGSSLAIDVSKVSGDQRVSKADSVAVEEPLEIQLSSASAEGAAAKSVSITMFRPGDDSDLTLGFLKYRWHYPEWRPGGACRALRRAGR